MVPNRLQQDSKAHSHAGIPVVTQDGQTCRIYEERCDASFPEKEGVSVAYTQMNEKHTFLSPVSSNYLLSVPFLKRLVFAV